MLNSSASSAEPCGAGATSRDQVDYGFDQQRVMEVRQSKRWLQNPKYFKRVVVSPSALLKMMIHAQSGVEKGIDAGGRPVEVMGLLLGRPDTSSLDTLVVSEALPLPVEGFETRVVADDQDVINYMIQLGDAVERTRQERIMGWYHSHPFDVTAHSQCFLSSTDISTQLQWQRAEDPHGNPWLSVVIDPLRSLAKGQPVLESFRVYPPEFNAPVNETPDGTVVTDERERVERWGACWNRYYMLRTEYFLSSLGSRLMGLLSEKYLWMRTLCATPMLERESRERFSDRITALADKLSACEGQLGHAGPGLGRMAGYLAAETGRGEPGKEESVMANPTKTAVELAVELCQGQTTQVGKSILFGKARVDGAADKALGTQSTVETKGSGGSDNTTHPPAAGGGEDMELA